MPPLKVLVTAGNTREMIDPVRYLSNVSTGVMGYEIAKACRASGYKTVLVSGPTALKPPAGVEFVPIVSSLDLAREVKKRFRKCDVLFMTSAVCDFRPVRFSKSKIKRKGFHRLMLEKTPDILKEAGRTKGRRIVVGFCLETEDLLRNARRKLREKNADYVVANFLGRGTMPFGKHKTSVTLVSKKGATTVRNVSKSQVARFLIGKVLKSRAR